VRRLVPVRRWLLRRLGRPRACVRGLHDPDGDGNPTRCRRRISAALRLRGEGRDQPYLGRELRCRRRWGSELREHPVQRGLLLSRDHTFTYAARVRTTVTRRLRARRRPLRPPRRPGSTAAPIAYPIGPAGPARGPTGGGCGSGLAWWRASVTPRSWRHSVRGDAGWPRPGLVPGLLAVDTVTAARRAYILAGRWWRWFGRRRRRTSSMLQRAIALSGSGRRAGRRRRAAARIVSTVSCCSC